MDMSTPKGRNCRVEIAATFGTAVAVQSISNALPAAVGATAHGQSEGAIGFLSASAGMEEALGQAVSVDGPTTDAFDAEGLDTTSFGTFTSGQLTPVATWSTLSNAANIDFGGGASEKLDATALIDTIRKEESGLLAAQTVNIGGFSDSQLAGMALVRAAALNDGYVVIRVTYSNGERRVLRGQPGLPGESIAVNQLATMSFDVAVKGQVLYLPAA
jgi:hypothetical protein